MNQTQVVAAIIKEENRYLIVQRNRNKHLGLKWEFPGGKVGFKESFKKALIREIKEELNNLTVSEELVRFGAMVTNGRLEYSQDIKKIAEDKGIQIEKNPNNFTLFDDASEIDVR